MRDRERKRRSPKDFAKEALHKAQQWVILVALYSWYQGDALMYERASKKAREEFTPEKMARFREQMEILEFGEVVPGIEWQKILQNVLVFRDERDEIIVRAVFKIAPYVSNQPAEIAQLVDKILLNYPMQQLLRSYGQWLEIEFSEDRVANGIVFYFDRAWLVEDYETTMTDLLEYERWALHFQGQNLEGKVVISHAEQEIDQMVGQLLKQKEPATWEKLKATVAVYNQGYASISPEIFGEWGKQLVSVWQKLEEIWLHELAVVLASTAEPAIKVQTFLTLARHAQFAQEQFNLPVSDFCKLMMRSVREHDDTASNKLIPLLNAELPEKEADQENPKAKRVNYWRLVHSHAWAHHST